MGALALHIMDILGDDVSRRGGDPGPWTESPSPGRDHEQCKVDQDQPADQPTSRPAGLIGMSSTRAPRTLTALFSGGDYGN